MALSCLFCQIAEDFGEHGCDEAGRLGGRVPSRLDGCIDFTYNGNNQVDDITRYSDLAGTTVVATTDYEYDALGRIENLHHEDSTPSNIANYTYTYDPVGNLLTEELNGTTTTYQYDDTNQLTGDGINTPEYDANGNRIDGGYDVGPINQYTTDGTWDYTYDDEGNMTVKEDTTAQIKWEYGYDHMNRLLSVDKTDTSTSDVLMTADYKYDPYGNRIEKAVDADGDGGGGTDTTRFSYDGFKTNGLSYVGTENWDIWADWDGDNSNAFEMRYIRGDAIDEIFAREDDSGTVAWYLTDRLGSVRDMTDNSGTVQNTIAYDGFGNITSESDTNFGDRYKWTGREHDVETGLHYNRARYYDPEIGRWISKDPLGFDAGDSNLYRYATNRPTVSTDPSGLQFHVTGGAGHGQITMPGSSYPKYPTGGVQPQHGSGFGIPGGQGPSGNMPFGQYKTRPGYSGYTPDGYKNMLEEKAESERLQKEAIDRLQFGVKPPGSPGTPSRESLFRYRPRYERSLSDTQFKQLEALRAKLPGLLAKGPTIPEILNKWYPKAKPVVVGSREWWAAYSRMDARHMVPELREYTRTYVGMIGQFIPGYTSVDLAVQGKIGDAIKHIAVDVSVAKALKVVGTLGKTAKIIQFGKKGQRYMRFSNGQLIRLGPGCFVAGTGVAVLRQPTATSLSRPVVVESSFPPELPDQSRHRRTQSLMLAEIGLTVGVASLLTTNESRRNRKRKPFTHIDEYQPKKELDEHPRLNVDGPPTPNRQNEGEDSPQAIGDCNTRDGVNTSLSDKRRSQLPMQKPMKNAAISCCWRALLVAFCLLCGFWVLQTATGPIDAKRASETAQEKVDSTPSWDIKAIENIQVGDLVLAQDPKTGETKPKRVVRVFKRTVNHLRILRVRSQRTSETQVIKTTNEHPFWVEGVGWKAAEKLAVGDSIRQLDGKTAIIIQTKYKSHPERIAVYNFQVEGFHTYFVAAHGYRGPPVLVHNTPPCVQILGRSPSSSILGQNLELMGTPRPANTAAHHIVAGGSKRAAQARAILKKHGIDINDADNGVFLPRNTSVANPPALTHSTLHTKKYYQEVTKRLQSATDLRAELRSIADELLDGTFPY